MPATKARTPGLHKPKSHIRLRLGGADGSPKSPSFPQHFSSSSTTTSVQISSRTVSTAQGTVESLNASTDTSSTGGSRWSGGASRDAFALDLSPSTADSASPHNPAFDTISYATASPQSISFGTRIENASSQLDPYESLTDDEYGSTESSDAINDFRRKVRKAPVLSETHPAIAHAIQTADDVYSMTEAELTKRFHFYEEIGYGNWGSVWRARPRKFKSSAGNGVGLKLGVRSAMLSGSEASGFIAVKVVHRVRDDGEPMTQRECDIVSARVKALWCEMKIIRTLRHEPHPSVINFEAFIITQQFAMAIMPYLSHLIDICLPPHRATPYMRQLASAVGYLHERGITHNDIKPANIMISYNNVPVLVDFGFAHRWEIGARGSFLSTITWGTPEYLDPYRARGLPHDERASDVWSLGVTMFELLVGRTPFEYENEGALESDEELLRYYERSARAEWLGEWSMPEDLEHLLRAMICPDPAYRFTAMQAYHHKALQPHKQEVIITPHFVRAAFDPDEHLDALPLPVQSHREDEPAPKEKKKPKKAQKKAHRPPPRAATPALGESIKQHTSVPFMHGTERGDGKPQNGSLSPKTVRAQHKTHLVAHSTKAKEDDITPTKRGKIAESLRVKELSLAEKTSMPRVSGGQANVLSRITSVNNLAATAKDHVANRDSTISNSSTAPAKNKADAVLRTMRSLEGTRRVKRVHSKDVLAAITRRAPSPPRPKSLDCQAEIDSRKNKEEQRRSLGLERKQAEVQEESPEKASAAKHPLSKDVRRPGSPDRNSPATSLRVPSLTSPPRPRVNTRPTEIVKEGRPFPAGEPASPLTELRHKILAMDNDNLERYRKVSGDPVSKRLSGALDTAVKTDESSRPLSSDASAATARLDKFASWVKDIERIVEDARKAIAEGREPDLKSIGVPEGLSVPEVSVVPPSVGGVDLAMENSTPTKTQQKRFGLTPPKSGAIPLHLRTSSTQVEPATPPKWMTELEAEEQVKKAAEAEAKKESELAAKPDDVLSGDGNQIKGKKSGSLGKMDLAVVKKGAKKERPAVSHVFKIFGNEKDKANARTNTPEPMGTVPLKSPGPVLRGAPSTPALRSNIVRQSKQLGRKSESNLRNFKAVPTLATLQAESEQAEHATISPRRAVYEDKLESEPGVVRHGEGWTSRYNPTAPVKPVVKTSSMLSLREKAMAFLRDDNRESRDLRLLQEEMRREQSRESKDLNGASGPVERNTTDLSKEVHDQAGRLKRGSRSDLKDTKRSPTPGATSTFRGQAEKKGFMGRLKGLVGRKGTERTDEPL